MEQHVLSGGTTRYDRTIGAILITSVLFLLNVGVGKLTRFDGWMFVLNYIPSLLLLILLTSGDQNFDVRAFPNSIVITVSVLLLLYVLWAVLFRLKLLFSIKTSIGGSILGSLWKSLLIMSAMFLIVCILGNTDEVFIIV